MVPDKSELLTGPVNIKSISELDIEDLLGRDEVIIDNKLLGNFLKNEIVLVTGAGGSVGSKISEEILKLNPKKLIILDSNEFALYSVQKTLAQMNLMSHKIDVIPILGSIQDNEKLKIIFKTFQPSVVYHAAAYKHVPIVEENIVEGLNNNIFGTLNLVNVAVKNKVKNFILISTDKAVRPTNIMGATKRVAEMILQAFSEKEKLTKFSMVRFGNVLGSSGSVVPLFWNQITSGGPVTITHNKITRFFMTNTEAVKLVIKASSISNGGDVFILDMGKPVTIKSLALRMINLAGKSLKTKANPSGDIEIKITGLRPGEKLYEEVLLGNNPTKTVHSRILRAEEEFLTWRTLNKKLNKLELSIKENNVNEYKCILKDIVKDYTPNKKNVDWLSLNV